MALSGETQVVKHFKHIDSPLGQILLVSDGRNLTGLYFVGQKYAGQPSNDWVSDPNGDPFPDAERELIEYFAGKRRAFDLPLAPDGTAFQLRVWRAIAAIPCGRTISYAALAQSLGAPRSIRAAAAATGRNPISIVVPCHRVVGSDGSLTGYAGALERKRRLLALETEARSVASSRRSAELKGQPHWNMADTEGAG